MPITNDATRHDEQVTTYFDTHVAAYDAFYEERSAFGRWFNRTFRKAVYIRRDEVPVLAKRYGCKTLLDVGCGSGRNTIFWANHGLERLYGVDLSAEMIETARQVAQQAGVASRCRFDQLDFMKFDSNEKWDIVAACGVFDYVRDAETFLRQMAKFADRIIYASFPGWTLVRSPLRKIRYALRGCPTHFYRRRAIEGLFAAVGFGELGMKSTGSGYLAWAVKG